MTNDGTNEDYMSQMEGQQNFVPQGYFDGALSDNAGGPQTQSNIAMFNLPQNQELMYQNSPALNIHNNLNYKHMTGMNAS